MSYNINVVEEEDWIIIFHIYHRSVLKVSQFCKIFCIPPRTFYNKFQNLDFSFVDVDVLDIDNLEETRLLFFDNINNFYEMLEEHQQ